MKKLRLIVATAGLLVGFSCLMLASKPRPVEAALPFNAVQYIDRILRPCSAGVVPYVSAITTSAGNVELTTCTGGAVNVNGVPVGTGSGTVTSVGLALPSIFTVSGTPVTTTGTLTGTFTTQTANTIFAGPASGVAATPTFRTLAVNDFNSGTGASGSTFWRGDGTWATPAGGITSLNGLTAATQTFATGTTGADFNISSVTSTHTFNLPDAAILARGLVNTTNQEFSGIKGFRVIWFGDPPFTGPEVQIDATNNFLRMQPGFSFGWTDTNPISTNIDTGLNRNAAGVVEINNGTPGTFADLKVRKHFVDQTITAAGTTGNQTINKAAGTVNFAAAATALTVTDSLVTTSSTIYGTLRTNDATCRLANIVPAAGSFVINMTGACTAETSVGFLVVN